jgi:hypothetical protein
MVKSVSGFAALLLVLVACGSQEASSDGEPPAATPSEQTQTAESDSIQCASAEDLDEIVTLLRSGQPTYNYQSALNVAELVGWADLSVAGSINSAVREMGGNGSHTALTVSDVEVLAGEGDITQFGPMAVWASRQEPDPLMDDVKFSGLRFVAMLDQFPSAPGGYAPYVEGLVLGCEDDKIPVRPLAEPPPNSEDLSLGELAESIRAAAVPPRDGNTASSAVDGPLIRHPNRSDGEDWPSAEVRGVLQLEADCVYVFLDEVDERYPVVWPASTTWDEENDEVVLASGVAVGVGESVYGAGGYFSVDDVKRIAGDEAAQLAATCVDNQYGEIAIVNNYDAAIGSG